MPKLHYSGKVPYAIAVTYVISLSIYSLGCLISRFLSLFPIRQNDSAAEAGLLLTDVSHARGVTGARAQMWVVV